MSILSDWSLLQIVFLADKMMKYIKYKLTIYEETLHQAATKYFIACTTPMLLKKSNLFMKIENTIRKVLYTPKHGS